MPRGRQDLSKAAILLLVLALAALAAGCGGGGGGGGTPTPSGDTTPPTITSMSATDATDFMGGTVTISARVTDDSGVHSVIATITKPDSSKATVTLSGTTNYSATWTAPANATSEPAVYTVVITAVDSSDQANSGTSSQFDFEVPNADVPPPPPSS